MYPNGISGKLGVPNVAVASVEPVKFRVDALIFAVTLPPVIATLLAFWVDIVPSPDTCVLLIAIVVLLAAVIRPLASTVIAGTTFAEPYAPAVTPDVVKVGFG